MDEQFWIKAWNEGRTQFHQPDHHPKLVEFFPRLDPKAGQKVLVPLCGKSKDMLWLHGLGLHVRGVELHEQAVRDFFLENGPMATLVSQDPTYTHYVHRKIAISSGDFFKLNEVEAYDFVYDRASLVALPPRMRKDYAQVIKRALKKDGQYLLIVYEYDQARMEGPPFSVSGGEIHELYQDRFSIQLMESVKPDGEGARLSALQDLRQNVYILRKTG
jgi:thiopurine S-methyltransferase